MKTFHGVPIINANSADQLDPYVAVIEYDSAKLKAIQDALSANKLVLVKSIAFEKAGNIFSDLVDAYGLRDSYDLQMQFVVHLMQGREALNDIAVTVNERDPYQFIQAHSEGDSSSPLDILALHCTSNATSGGENIFSLVNQDANYSNLSAKEKAVVGHDLTDAEIQSLRINHRDAKAVIDTCPNSCRVLVQSGRGSVVVRKVPLARMQSVISGNAVTTLWDNVTVHDHAFHRHQYELLTSLAILHHPLGDDYKNYMHVEPDSDWAPADTNSGSVKQIANLFSCHVLYKMEPGDLLILNNRIWTHSVNNWPPSEERELSVMYA